MDALAALLNQRTPPLKHRALPRRDAAREEDSPPPDPPPDPPREHGDRSPAEEGGEEPSGGDSPSDRQSQQRARMEAAQEAWRAARRVEIAEARRERQLERPRARGEREGRDSFKCRREAREAREAEQARRRAEAERCWREACEAELELVRRGRRAQLRLPEGGGKAAEEAEAHPRAAAGGERELRRAQELRAREAARREVELAAQRAAREKEERRREERQRSEAAAAELMAGSASAAAAAAAAAAAKEEEQREQAALARAEERAAREEQEQRDLQLFEMLAEQDMLEGTTHPRLLTEATSIWAALSKHHGGVAEVRLVRLSWLLDRAARRLHLPRRSELEASSEASGEGVRASPFLSLSEMRELPTGFNGQLPLLAVQAVMTSEESYSAQWLEALAATITDMQTCEASFQRLPAEAGVFIEWCSLPQPNKNGGGRSADEQAAYRAAVCRCRLWYAHELVTVVLHGGGHAGSHSRRQQVAPSAEAAADGWLMFARELSLLRTGVSAPRHCAFLSWPQHVEVGNPLGAAASSPPLPPEQLGSILATKRWPAGTASARLATELYNKALTAFLGGLVELRLVHEDWTEDDVVGVVSLLPLCVCATHLTIGIEAMGRRGFSALGNALSEGALPELQYLSVGQNIIGRDAAPLLEALIPSGDVRGDPRASAPLPTLRVLNFFGVLIEDAPLSALAKVIGEGGLQGLEDLQIWTQKAGAEGIMALAEVIKNGCASRLQFVDMSGDTVKALDRKPTKAHTGPEHKPAGKGPAEAMRRACSEKAIQFSFSNSTNYKI